MKIEFNMKQLKRKFNKDLFKFDFDSKGKRYVFAGLSILIIISAIFTISSMEMFSHQDSNQITGNSINLGSEKTPQEMYQKFQCSCCGQSIAADCCGMAKQRKAYVDELLLDGLNENEITVEMVKKFGFDILMNPSEEGNVREYIQGQASDNPPKIEITPTSKDLGTIKQTNEKISTFFTIKNTGKGDLVIENMDTSCMCTSVRIIYNDEEGPLFGMSMHGENPKDYKLTIPAGDSAQLEVIYDPMAHGKQKKPVEKITREVTIISNDPIDFQKKVRIELTQIH